MLHRVPGPAEEPQTVSLGRSGFIVSLAIKDERRFIAVAEQAVARHVP